MVRVTTVARGSSCPGNVSEDLREIGAVRDGTGDGDR